MESMNEEAFRGRTIVKLTDIMIAGTPSKTQPAALGVLQQLSSSEPNVTKIIFSSRLTNTGTGMSQVVADVLVTAEKIRLQNK
jgi:hypothetical protein